MMRSRTRWGRVLLVQDRVMVRLQVRVRVQVQVQVQVQADAGAGAGAGTAVQVLPRVRAELRVQGWGGLEHTSIRAAAADPTA